jgi:hypothetical protein
MPLQCLCTLRPCSCCSQVLHHITAFGVRIGITQMRRSKLGCSTPHRLSDVAPRSSSWGPGVAWWATPVMSMPGPHADESLLRKSGNTYDRRVFMHVMGVEMRLEMPAVHMTTTHTPQTAMRMYMQRIHAMHAFLDIRPHLTQISNLQAHGRRCSTNRPARSGDERFPIGNKDQ